MVRQPRVVIDQFDGNVACGRDPFAIAAQGRELQVVAALLTLSHDRALATDVEIDFCELEAVLRAHEGVQTLLGLGCSAGAHDDAPRCESGPSADPAAELVELRHPEP